jgi:hypothetical protein
MVSVQRGILLFVGGEVQDAVRGNYVLKACFRVTGLSKEHSTWRRSGTHDGECVRLQGAWQLKRRSRSPAPYVIQAAGPGGALGRLNATRPFLQPHDGATASHLPFEPPENHQTRSSRLSTFCYSQPC